jgi:hypothetical protein
VRSPACSRLDNFLVNLLVNQLCNRARYPVSRRSSPRTDRSAVSPPYSQVVSPRELPPVSPAQDPRLG